MNVSEKNVVAFDELYGGEKLCAAKERYANIEKKFEEIFGKNDGISFFSAPGRTEILGNHTDHQRGRVIAGSVDLDIIAAAAPCDDGRIVFHSEGFSQYTVDTRELSSVSEDNFTSHSIIRGMCDGFLKNGYKIGGFCAYAVSEVLKGSGLSSSAAFEVLIGDILNHLYNGGKIPNTEIARIAQYAENVHFGKPSGLMDQMACAVGGLITIDFLDKNSAKVEKLDFDLSKKGYSLCIVNTGGSHADLNEDYASVPAEMKSVAEKMGGEVLRDIKKEDIIKNIKTLRDSLGDRAILRALHFENENERVGLAVKALINDDLSEFFGLIRSSGLSSETMLQNIYSVKNVKEQGLTLALSLMDEFFETRRVECAYRVHGGGFAGTVQAFMPDALTADFRNFFDSVFGDGATYVLKIRRYGAVKVEREKQR